MSEAQPPTKRQLAVLNAIYLSITLDGFPPTQRELADHCNCHRQAVVRYLDELERKGLIARRAMVARAVALTDKGLRYVKA